MAVVDVRDVSKSYAQSERRVEAVRGVSLALDAGSFTAIVGPSGCGKSTLLHLCGAMDRPTSGEVRLVDRSLATLSDDELTRLRRERVGFVFQFFNLLPTLTVVENIALPLRLAGRAETDAVGRAATEAGRVGLGDRLDHYPSQLSGGEAQRAALARAVVHRPAVLIADEPTGNLDSVNGARVLELLLGLNRDEGVAVLLATHDTKVAAAAQQVIHMRDGRVERTETARPATSPAVVHVP